MNRFLYETDNSFIFLIGALMLWGLVKRIYQGRFKDAFMYAVMFCGLGYSLYTAFLILKSLVNWKLYDELFCAVPITACWYYAIKDIDFKHLD